MGWSDQAANRRRRRSVSGVGTAAGAAFAAALLGMGTAPTAGAIVVDVDPDPFQDLLGNTGFNSWTVGADEDLAAFTPTFADSFDTGVDNFLAADANPFSSLAFAFDPTTFSANPDLGGLPLNATGDLAVGLDYALSATGTNFGTTLDGIVDSLLGFIATPAAAVAPDVDPFEDLFGTGGTNTWTTMGDNTLATLGLGGNLDGLVDSFQALADADPFTDLAYALDPTAFSADPDLGGLPVNGIGDFAVGLDYTLSFTGAGIALDPIIDNLLSMLPTV